MTEIKDVAPLMNTEQDLLDEGNESIFDDIRYICGTTGLITESLQKGFDVAQLPNGDLIVTEVKIVNVHYTWSKEKQKMIKLSQS